MPEKSEPPYIIKESLNKNSRKIWTVIGPQFNHSYYIHSDALDVAQGLNEAYDVGFEIGMIRKMADQEEADERDE